LHTFQSSVAIHIFRTLYEVVPVSLPPHKFIYPS